MSNFLLSARPDLRSRLLPTGAAESADKRLTLLDVSHLARLGARGRQAQGFFQSQALPIPEAPNLATLAAESLHLLRLSRNEFWLVATAAEHEPLLNAMESRLQKTAGLYRLYCQHSHGCFLLQGATAADLFARLCAVDLRPQAFAVGAIAQTSMARTNVVIVRLSTAPEKFLILVDVGYAPYLWSALVDALQQD